MFRRRAVQMTFVKTPKDETAETESIFDGPERLAAYSEVAKDFLGFAAIVIGGTLIAVKVVGGIVDASVNMTRK